MPGQRRVPRPTARARADGACPGHQAVSPTGCVAGGSGSPGYEPAAEDDGSRRVELTQTRPAGRCRRRPRRPVLPAQVRAGRGRTGRPRTRHRAHRAASCPAAARARTSSAIRPCGRESVPASTVTPASAACTARSAVRAGSAHVPGLPRAVWLAGHPVKARGDDRQSRRQRGSLRSHLRQQLRVQAHAVLQRVDTGRNRGRPACRLL